MPQQDLLPVRHDVAEHEDGKGGMGVVGVAPKWRLLFWTDNEKQRRCDQGGEDRPLLQRDQRYHSSEEKAPIANASSHLKSGRGMGPQGQAGLECLRCQLTAHKIFLLPWSR